MSEPEIDLAAALERLAREAKMQVALFEGAHATGPFLAELAHVLPIAAARLRAYMGAEGDENRDEWERRA